MPYSKIYLASEDGKKKRSQINKKYREKHADKIQEYNKKYREQLRAYRIWVAREYGVNPINIQLGLNNIY